MKESHGPWQTPSVETHGPVSRKRRPSKFKPPPVVDSGFLFNYAFPVGRALRAVLGILRSTKAPALWLERDAISVARLEPKHGYSVTRHSGIANGLCRRRP